MQEVFTLRQQWPRLEGRGRLVLWVLFSGNDLEELAGANGSLAHRIPAWLRWNNVFAKRSPLRYAVRKGVARFEASPTRVIRRQLGGKTLLFHRGYLEAKDRTLTEVIEHPNYARLQRAFKEMGRLAGEQQIEVAVILIPPKSEVYSWVLNEKPETAFRSGFSQAIEDLARHQGFRYLDLGPVFEEAGRQLYDRSGKLLWWLGDTHWNPLGHALAVDTVYARIPVPQLG